MWGNLLLDIKENDDASDIINDILLFLPSFECLTYEALSSTFCVLLEVEWIYDPCHINVFEKLPDAIGGENNELVIFVEVKLSKLWYSVYSNPGRDLISKRSSHCETRDVFILEPHSERTQRVPIGITVRVDSSIVSHDDRGLILIVRLVIISQGISCDLAAG